MSGVLFLAEWFVDSSFVLGCGSRFLGFRLQHRLLSSNVFVLRSVVPSRIRFRLLCHSVDKRLDKALRNTPNPEGAFGGDYDLLLLIVDVLCGLGGRVLGMSSRLS